MLFGYTTVYGIPPGYSPSLMPDKVSNI